MRNFIAFTLLLLSIAVTCQAKLTVECVVDYLKFRNIQDEMFDSIDVYSGDPGTCSDNVKAKVKEYYENVRSKMEANFKQRPYADCTMKDVEGEIYENLLLKAEAIELKGVGLKFWKLSSKKSKIEDIQRKAQDVVDNAIIKCKGQADYGAFFDSFYEQKRTEPMTDEFDFCMRKHLVDKSVVNPSLYNFKVNPKNIRTDNVDCAGIMKIALEQMEVSISNAGSGCVIDAFINNGYLDLIMKIQLISKLTLNPLEKENEKRSFVNSMISMTHKIKTCSM